MKSSPAPLVNHLRRHPEQYQEYMSVKDKLDSKTAVKSSKNQLTMSSFTTSVSSTKDSFKKAYLQWIVNNNLLLAAGEAPAFVSMIKTLNKSVSVPGYKMTYDLFYRIKTEATRKLKS
jgi:hypothetical protein